MPHFSLYEKWGFSISDQKSETALKIRVFHVKQSLAGWEQLLVPV